MSTPKKFTDSSGRVVVSRYTSHVGGRKRHLWSLSVDGAWLGHFGGGLPSVSNHAAAFTWLGARPLDEADILNDINKDMVLKGLKEAQQS